MPTYQYICNHCSNVSEVTHGMDEIFEKCPHCETEKQLKKIPSSVMILKHKEQLRSEHNQKHVPGEIVKSSIDEIKEDILIEKEKLKQRVFDPTKK